MSEPTSASRSQRLAGLSDKTLGLVLDATFDLYGILDGEGKVIEMTGRVFEGTRTDASMLVGQMFAETVFWQSSENTAALLSKAVASALNGSETRLTLDFRKSASLKVPLELSLIPVTNEPSPGARLVVCGRSVALPNQSGGPSPASENLLTAAESAEIGIWYWDFVDKAIYSTPRCNELLGLPRYEPMSIKQFRSVVHPDDRDAVMAFIEQSAREGTQYEEEFRVIYPDGDAEWICAEGKSILGPDGKPSRMMGVVRNITEEKLSSEEVSKIHEREKKAREEAVEANRAKDFFLAFVSHELRAPLNAILGWSKILLTKEVDEETRVNALQTIERSARVQTKLINDLVDSARVASGKLRLEYRPTNLADLVRGAYQAHMPSAESRGVDLTYHADREDVIVFGDANRLQQVFGNLLSNAIKFTPENGKVSISIETEESSANIVIEDNGQGISEAALPRIFRQFSQGDENHARASAGLGLGLSIAKILAERHGGSISAASPGIGKGSRFTVVLPLASSAKEVVDRVKEIDGPSKRPLENVRILLVEDDADSREVLQLFLEQSGAAVRSTTSAKEAMQELLRSGGRLPDLIISDLAMPEEDGYTLIAKIRELPTDVGGQVPALALSAFTTNESKERAYAAGFQRYSTKPFEPELLIDEIHALLGKK